MADRIVLTKSLSAASANCICQSQTPSGAGNLTLNGSAVSGGVATLDTQRRVLFTFAGNETGHTFKVTGTREGGIVISESVGGTIAGTVATNLDFLTVTEITISAAAAGAIQVGTNGVGSTSWKLPNVHMGPMNLQIGCETTGTVNYSIEYTFDDYYTPPPFGSPTVIPVVFEDGTVTNKTANEIATMNDAVLGWRLTINSGTGSVTAIGIQAGIRN